MHSTNGTGATRRPNSWATTTRSTKLAPPPPAASGTAIIGTPVCTRCSQTVGSKPSGSAARTTDDGDALAKRPANASRSATWSSVKFRST